MSKIEVEYPQILLGPRIQDYLRRRYGAHAAKRAAAITGADLRTARGWLEEGREPKGWALLSIIRDMGRDGLLALFSPEIETHEQKLEREIHELREEAARLEACLGKGGAPAADRMAPVSREGTRKGRVNQNPVRRVRPRSGRAHRRPVAGR